MAPIRRRANAIYCGPTARSACWFSFGSDTVVNLSTSCVSFGRGNEWDFVMLVARHPKVRLGERRNKARLFCQRVLEEMYCERQRLKDSPAHAISDEEEEANLQ
jgi:hypothetical protein